VSELRDDYDARRVPGNHGAGIGLRGAVVRSAFHAPDEHEGQVGYPIGLDHLFPVRKYAPEG